jgi:hypothetical protein
LVRIVGSKVNKFRVVQSEQNQKVQDNRSRITKLRIVGGRVRKLRGVGSFVRKVG